MSPSTVGIEPTSLLWGALPLSYMNVVTLMMGLEPMTFPRALEGTRTPNNFVRSEVLFH